MWEHPKAVFNKKPNFLKLQTYGFVKRGQEYLFSTEIVDGSFLVNVFVHESGKTSLQIIDRDTDEEYAMAYLSSSVGEFVGRVKEEAEKALCKIVEGCFEQNVFQLEQTQTVIDYIKNKYQVEAEFLWESTPNNAIFRVKNGKKWFAVLMTLDGKKLGLQEAGQVEVVNLKARTEDIEGLLEKNGYFAGFHMNKKHWYTARLNGALPDTEVFHRIDESYRLIDQK